MNFPVSAFHSPPRHKPLITEAANCLQPIQGSGLVRDLRETMACW